MAGYVNKIIYSQEDTNDFYTVGGSYNLNSYEDLLEFKKVNNISFPLATKDELGYLYLNGFDNILTFIGKNNRIVGTLSDEATTEEIDTMLKLAMASFYDIYLTKESEKILLTDTTVEIDLKNYFYCEDYTKVEFVVKSSTNPYIVDPLISGTKLILNKKSVLGFSKLDIIAKVPGKEIYAQSKFEIINPSALYEDFEIEKLADSKVPWINTGDASWFITEEESFFNSKSIRSGRISPNQTSGINLQLDLYEPGTLIFAYKTSTRPYFDRLHFTFDSLDISDTESPNLWSGVNDWRILYFSVRAGKRSFSWEYIKGPYDPYNLDIVWLDVVVVPDKINVKSANSGIEKNISLSSFPNPFNPVTEISFELIKNENIELTVFDVKGRQVADIHKGMLDKGTHSFSFDGSRLSSGIYYSVLKYGDKILTNKLILAK